MPDGWSNKAEAKGGRATPGVGGAVARGSWRGHEREDAGSTAGERGRVRGEGVVSFGQGRRTRRGQQRAEEDLGRNG